MVRMRGRRRMALVSTLLLGITLSAPFATPSTAAPTLLPTDARCAAPQWSEVPSVVTGHLYLSAAYQALSRDRARFAGLGPLRRSLVLSAVAEQHSAYMASIGSWSDGDPAGSILSRVHMAGLTDAVYSGQNVVTANGSSVADAIRNGEAFFAREANGGGPHWDNITNPNHHYVGMGLAVLGSAGNYTIYLTQVFSDVGGCATLAESPATQAGSTSPALKAGAVVHPTVDILQLRSEPQGMVIGTLHAQDHLKIIGLQNDWAQVLVISSKLYGWVYAPFLST
jgi:uncharacterized protein YkwD